MTSITIIDMLFLTLYELQRIPRKSWARQLRSLMDVFPTKLASAFCLLKPHFASDSLPLHLVWQRLSETCIETWRKAWNEIMCAWFRWGGRKGNFGWDFKEHHFPHPWLPKSCRTESGKFKVQPIIFEIISRARHRDTSTQSKQYRCSRDDKGLKWWKKKLNWTKSIPTTKRWH